jgi:hypothetical protein
VAASGPASDSAPPLRRVLVGAGPLPGGRRRRMRGPGRPGGTEPPGPAPGGTKRPGPRSRWDGTAWLCGSLRALGGAMVPGAVSGGTELLGCAAPCGPSAGRCRPALLPAERNRPGYAAPCRPSAGHQAPLPAERNRPAVRLPAAPRRGEAARRRSRRNGTAPALPPPAAPGETKPPASCRSPPFLLVASAPPARSPTSPPPRTPRDQGGIALSVGPFGPTRERSARASLHPIGC